ncbi:hypothetical protein GCM10007977_001370 [Dactylosporangium sucinum]|uniref:Uncharacterized protein n=1 Tax=Dactylosporangium sucinum TaxID=1424081 RepID=A0A917SZI7_9ACTN|nr:hypothetical protein GCM10007977_001370 [Dactylosporangium sucinum]
MASARRRPFTSQYAPKNPRVPPSNPDRARYTVEITTRSNASGMTMRSYPPASACRTALPRVESPTRRAARATSRGFVRSMTASAGTSTLANV